MTFRETNTRRRPGVGRPRHTWLRTLNADLHPLNHGLNSAWRLAQDREWWRQLVEITAFQFAIRINTIRFTWRIDSVSQKNRTIQFDHNLESVCNI